MENFRKNILNIIIFLVAISAVISIAIFIFHFNEERRLEETILRDVIGRRLEHSFAMINDFPGSAGKDILFLRALSSVRSLHNAAGRKISPEVYGDFKNILRNNSAYKDLFFYKKNFNCVMRVSGDNKYDNDSCETPSPFIADIIKQAAPLSSGEAHISLLMTYEGVAVIAYATPVNDNDGIISIINANYFLEEIRRLSREKEAVFLLDKDGAYLANVDRAKEKFSGSADNFYRDFSEVPGRTLSDAGIRWLETEDKIFAFWRIYPTESNFAIYEGANKILGEKHQDEYFWIMAAVSDKLDKSLRYGYLPDVLAIITMLMMPIFIIIFLSIFKFYINEIGKVEK